MRCKVYFKHVSWPGKMLLVTNFYAAVNGTWRNEKAVDQRVAAAMGTK